MSAAGRSDAAGTGHVRHGDDFYATPAWATRAILPVLEDIVPVSFCEPDSVIDPCCGEGAILDVVADRWPDVWRYGVELDAGRAAIASRTHRTVPADALGAVRWPSTKLVLTNPPFSLAMEFARRAFAEVAPNGTICMLLRLNWLASQKRADWLRTNTPSVYVLPKRPSFTGDGKSDSADYAWMVWRIGIGPAPTVAILGVP